jgi:hypothetical protein
MNRLALSILIERRERQKAAREQRKADPHVLLCLRVKPRFADWLEEQAAARGISIDQRFEQIAEERA